MHVYTWTQQYIAILIANNAAYIVLFIGDFYIIILS